MKLGVVCKVKFNIIIFNCIGFCLFVCLLVGCCYWLLCLFSVVLDVVVVVFFPFVGWFGDAHLIAVLISHVGSFKIKTITIVEFRQKKILKTDHTSKNASWPEISANNANSSSCSFDYFHGSINVCAK